MHNKETLFDHLFRTGYARLYRLAFSLLRDEEESRDVVSDVFANLLASERTLPEGAELDYLAVSVRNACLSRMAQLERTERLRRLYPIELSLSLAPYGPQEQRWREVNQYIAHHLPPAEAEVLRLVYGQHLSYAEAARQAGVTTAAINQRLVRALHKLRAHFKSIHHD